MNHLDSFIANGRNARIYSPVLKWDIFVYIEIDTGNSKYYEAWMIFNKTYSATFLKEEHIRAILKKAPRGDTRAAELLLDRAYGCVKQRIDHTTSRLPMDDLIKSIKILKVSRHEYPDSTFKDLSEGTDDTKRYGSCNIEKQ